MKKFLLSLAIGYVLIFTVYLGWMGRGKKQPLFTKGTELPASIRDHLPPEKSAPSAAAGVLKKDAPVPPLKLKKDQELEKPKSTGPVETFYQNGKISSEWILQDTGEGVFKTYTPEGKPWMEMPFAGQHLEGMVRSYYPDGKLFSEEPFTRGIKKGEAVWRYDKNQAWMKMDWKADGTAELTELYSEDGRRADHPAVRAGEEKSTSYFKAYDASGHEVMNWQQAGGEQSTTFKSYYQTGAVSSEWGFKNGKLNGRGVFYYPDGKIWIETEFVDGKPAGHMAVSAPDQGMMLEQNTLVKPVAGEETKAYYPDGKPFWVLTKEEANGQDLIFRLQTYWQSDASEKTMKELLTPPAKEAGKPEGQEAHESKK